MKLASQVSILNEKSSRAGNANCVIYCPLSPSSFVGKHITWGMTRVSSREYYLTLLLVLN